MALCGHRGALLAGVTALVLAAAALAPAVAQDSPGRTGAVQARTVLPPGNSQHVTVAGQARGQASGDPDAYGDHVDDQRDLYWSFDFKDGALRPEPFCDAPQQPQGTSTVCFDEWGVPVAYGDTTYDVWYAAGYAIAQIRLFELDAIRRIGTGTLAELTGPGAVPADVQTRVLTYSEEEYEAQLARQSEEDLAATRGYVDGVNAYIGELRTTRRHDMPAEYVLLQAEPEPITLTDVAATGVLMTRAVASAGGEEMLNVIALQQLQEAFGRDAGRRIFQDLNWVEDEQAAVTVFDDEGVFPRPDLATGAARQQAFHALADWASNLPADELLDGPGTGAYPVPEPDPTTLSAPPESTGPGAAALGVARATAVLDAWRQRIDGGSFLVSIAPSRTADGSTLLVSEPQLDQNPQQLVELEVHGAGYHARGSTVPGVPVVGIGYNDHVAWALTTGYSKTIDSFVVEQRPDSDGDGAPEYRYEGGWRNQDCRTETVHYRFARSGVPTGPAVFTEDVQVCRTVHGPIVATSEDGSLARAVQYHMWDREVDTLQGVLAWNRATNLAEFEAAMRTVTWNENTGYADREGNIAYWHPGLHRIRPAGSDPRMPLPGDGSMDLGAHVPFDDLPHVVNPEKGWIANWNNKPAHGWGDQGGLVSSSYPSGHGQRVQNLFEILSLRDDWTFDNLTELDRFAGQRDMRVREFRPLLLGLRDRTDLSPTERAALEVVAAWNGDANGEGADMQPPLDYTDQQYADEVQATVGAGPTVFDAFVDALVEAVLADVEPVAGGWIDHLGDTGRHVYEVGSLENFALRVVDPSTSSLTPSRDYTGGLGAEGLVRDVFGDVVSALAEAQGDDPATWRSEYGRMEEVCSASGVIGPCGAMPFLERGAWIHMAGFPASTTPPTAEREPGPAPLPATGAGAAALGVALLGVAAVVRPRRGRPAAR